MGVGPGRGGNGGDVGGFGGGCWPAGGRGRPDRWAPPVGVLERREWYNILKF
uniref:Uncharacterized protein n=1 Tax=Oryza sativa subsp. japonica TaxID=39947 RepID=Q6K427_ORYSJ|nr:hypothetical protein [Oryza sativa Japonica Group]BAD22322.1 hypothetical protein [Oryza sativa Japonica Group]